MIDVKNDGEYNINHPILSNQKATGKEQLENYEIAKKLGADDYDYWDDWKEKVENYKKQIKNKE